MRHRYPKKSRYLVFSEGKDGTVQIHNCAPTVYDDREFLTVSPDTADYINRLDGKTSPYRIDESLTRYEVRQLIRELRINKLLDDRKRFRRLGFTVLLTLYIPRCADRLKKAATVWNNLLMLLWIPALIAGIWTFANGDFPLTESTISPYIWMLLGMAAGMFLHEVSHAAACLSYGGHFFEMGLTCRFLMPGAYVLIDYSEIKSRFKRAQIDAAGVEMNFLLAGILLLLVWIPGIPFDACLYAGIINILTGLLNMAMVFGVDGMNVFCEFLSGKDTLVDVLAVLTSRPMRRALAAQGINGRVTIASCYVLAVFQLLSPILTVMSVVAIVLMFK